MGLWDWFTRRRPATVARRAIVKGDGTFAFNIIGEPQDQSVLEQIVGKRTEQSAEFYCAALLSPEPKNDDPSAVAVIIRGARVGYLNREEAASFRFVSALRKAQLDEAVCAAVIVRGSPGEGADIGSFRHQVGCGFANQLSRTNRLNRWQLRREIERAIGAKPCAESLFIAGEYVLLLVLLIVSAPAKTSHVGQSARASLMAGG